MSEVTVTQQVADQYKAVAYLAESIALVHREIEPMIRASIAPELDQMRGERSARIMEALGNFLNEMDAVDTADAWMAPVFENAQKLFPAFARYRTASVEAATADLRERLAEVEGENAQRDRLLKRAVSLFQSVKRGGHWIGPSWGDETNLLIEEIDTLTGEPR